VSSFRRKLGIRLSCQPDHPSLARCHSVAMRAQRHPEKESDQLINDN
jgi:hypothetical protein